METRKITIVATREQKKYVINSAATTLGELKADLDDAGINYEDMSFMEGLTRTEILKDDSILPHDVERVNRETGETYVTNELVFMLTNTRKKIRSGADRKSCYDYIKSHGLQAEVQKTFGKNFTQVKTDDLIKFVEKKSDKKEEAVATPVAPVEEKIEEFAAEVQVPVPEHIEYVDLKARRAIKLICAALHDYSDGFEDIYDEVMDMFEDIEVADDSEPCEPTPKKEVSPYSDDEIDDMFADLTN